MDVAVREAIEDPIVALTSFDPMDGSSGANYQTHTLYATDDGVLEFKLTRGARALITVETPGEPKPSSNSLQPVMPASVVSFTKW